MKYFLAMKKNKIFPFATAWMDLEGIMLSEIKSDRERQMTYDFTYMWNLENKPNQRPETDS